MRTCISCRWFRDGQFNHTYITPRCTQRGDDDCAYMRQFVCGLDGELWEQPETREGTEHGSAINSL